VAIDREKLLLSAGKLVDKKKYDKAIVEYRKIVQNDPNDARTLLRIGDIQSRQQDYAGAIATYDKVATHYATQGFQLKAIAVIKQIRELIRKHAPELAARYSHITPRLADIYAELNLVTDALAAYDEVATMYQKGGRDREAIEVFEKMVSLDPKNPLPHLRLAEARCRVKQLDEAILSFWTASELLLGLKRPDDALKVIERILHFKQEPIYARAAAQLYLQKGNTQGGMLALARLQIAFQTNPKDLDTLALLAQAFDTINQGEKALEVHLEMARLSRDQNRPELWAEIIAHLKAIAPSHEGLIALEKAGPPRNSQGPGALSDAPSVGKEAPSAGAPPRRPPPAKRPGPPPLSAPPTSTNYQALSRHAPALEVTELPAEDIDVEEDIEYIEEEAEVPASSLPAPRAKMASVLPASRKPQISSPSIRGSQPDLDDFDLDADFEEDLDLSQSSTSTSLGASEPAPSSEFHASNPHHKALADAESFRTLGLLDKAVEALHLALDLDPNSIVIREKLREILVEANEREAAIQETLNIATIHIHNQNPNEAEPLAREVLELEADNGDALNILDHVAALRDAPPSVTDEGNLAAYDIESVHPSQALNQIPEDPRLPKFDHLQDIDESDFDDEAPISLRAQHLSPPAAKPSLPPYPVAAQPAEHALDAPPASVASASAKAIGARPSPEAIEEVLEEAEFFAAQGLYSDAEAILLDMLKSAPHHVLLTEQLTEVQALLKGEVDDSDEEAPDSLLEDNSFDIAASLDALDDLDEPSLAPEMTSPEQELDVDQVFAKFKEGVKAVVNDSDAATHYDLGLAYKEMGLSEDACSEFELASNDPSRACMCFAMVGLIRREQKDLPGAKKAFLQALGTDEKNVDQELSIEYDLALICEAEGNQSEYVAYLRAVAKKKADYRDVAARMRALGESVPTSSEADDDDEFDAAFDNLF